MNMGLHTDNLMKAAYPVELREMGIEPMPLADMRRRNRIRGMQEAWLNAKAAKAPAAKIKARKINRDRRRYLTEQVIAILRTGEPTVFAHEADCRNGLRIALCLDGWTWAEAEAAAEGVLLTALRYIGAKRPTWYEGQPGYCEEGYSPVEHTRCLRCHGPMPDEPMQNGWQRQYCSNLCSKSDRLKFERISGERRTLAQYWAAMAATGEVKRLQRQRACKWCGADFIPRNIVDDIEHCSKSCGSKTAAAAKKVMKPCRACGKSYHASGPGAGKFYCSKTCSNSVVAIMPKPCEWCGKDFKPRRPVNRFCSTSCSARWRTAPKNAQSGFYCDAAE